MRTFWIAVSRVNGGKGGFSVISNYLYTNLYRIFRSACVATVTKHFGHVPFLLGLRQVSPLALLARTWQPVILATLSEANPGPSVLHWPWLVCSRSSCLPRVASGGCLSLRPAWFAVERLSACLPAHQSPAQKARQGPNCQPKQSCWPGYCGKICNRFAARSRELRRDGFCPEWFAGNYFNRISWGW